MHLTEERTEIGKILVPSLAVWKTFADSDQFELAAIFSWFV